MAEVKVDVIGVQDIMDALAELPKEIQEEVLRQAVEAGALVLEDEAKRLAPYRTGALRESIQAREVRPRKNEFVRFAIGPKIRYAGFVEFGTAHNPAQPYMRPAKDNKRNPVIRDAREEVLAGVERLAAGKGNR